MATKPLLGENNQMKQSYIKKLRKVLESQFDEAESLIAARSFGQEMQDMVEKLGRLSNEDLPAVAEQMRNTFGPDLATAFENQVMEVLEQVMSTLRDAKQNVDNSVAAISAGQMPRDITGTMDMEQDEFNLEDDDLDLDVEDDDLGDLEGDDLDLDVGDDHSDVSEPLGRTKKESVEHIKQKIAEAKALLSKIKKMKPNTFSDQTRKLTENDDQTGAK